jgi:HSP20 family protein
MGGMKTLKFNTMKPIMQNTRPYSGYFPTFFDELFNDLNSSTLPKTTTLAVNVRENETMYSLEVLAPGFSKEDITIDMENNVLTISGEAKKEEMTENEKFTRKEFNFQSFKRSFTLPENKIDSKAIEAKYADGVLKVSLPKIAEELRKTQKRIAVV